MLARSFRLFLLARYDIPFWSLHKGPTKIWYYAPNRQRVQEYKISQLT